jgi:two-component system, chemotaxis family, sensor histidine kinase and response regulator WspE
MKNSPPARILVVDDNRDGLLIRRSLLEEQGYSVEVAPGGEEGFELYRASAFDVLVTDYRMPRMNGVDLIRRIRAIAADARIVLLSGFVEPLGLTEANTGADAVIAKSANEPTHLLRAIKRLLNPDRAKRKPPSSQQGSPRSRTAVR